MLGSLDIFPQNLLEELGDNPSVLGLVTSEPKYLLFSDTSSTPKFVLQPGTKSKLTIIKEYTVLLNQSLPERIPEPLAILCDDNNQYYLVQRGIEGVPWFTLRERIGKDITWREIVDQSLGALAVFHSTTASYPTWSKSVNLQTHYIELHDQSRALDNEALKNQEAVFNCCSSILSRQLPLDCFMQHGDFCVNNLIFRSHSTGIIDFEHLGRVHLPMHDEFLLMESLLQLQESPTIEFTSALWEEILNCSKYKFPKDSQIISVLLIMHIMWWLIEIHGNKRRLVRKNKYLLALNQAHEEIVKNGSNFVEKVLIIMNK